MTPTLEELMALLVDVCDEPGLTPDTELLDSGLLDSFGIITLLAEFEDRYNIEIFPTRLSHDAFKSPLAIWGLLKNK